MTRTTQTGAGLIDALLGLAVGLLVLQAMLDALAVTQASVLLQRQELRRLEGQALVRQVARALADGARASPPGSLMAEAGRHGDVLRAEFALSGPCAAAAHAADRGAQPQHAQHARVGLDGRGTLQCSSASAVAQPLADELGDWRVEFLEQTTPTSSRAGAWLRLHAPSEVQDWRQVRLLQLSLQSRAPGHAASMPAPLRLQYALRASAPA